MDFVLKTVGWLLLAWTVPNLIAVGIFWSETLKEAFVDGYEVKLKKGWRAHGFFMLFLFTGCLTLWYHLVFIWTVTGPSLGPTVIP